MEYQPLYFWWGVDVCNASLSILMFVAVVVVVGEINDHPAYCRVRCLCAVVCSASLSLYIYIILCIRITYMCVTYTRGLLCIVCRCNALNSVKIYIHSGPILSSSSAVCFFFSTPYRFSLS